MAGIEGAGVRLTVAEQIQLRGLKDPPAGKTWEDFRNRPLGLSVIDGVSGRILRASEVVAAGVQGIAGVIEAAASRVLEIIRPEMITSDKLSFNIMKNYLTVAMFRQFIEDEATRPDGYRITGHNADKLIELLADRQNNDKALIYVNYDDAVAYVTWYNEKTGENKRIMTEAEWEEAKREVGNQLEKGLWEWTKDLFGGGPARVLRFLGGGNRSLINPGNRYLNSAVRFVEDKK